jgi:hypothetical protein
VILFRATYGQSQITNVEEAAIRDRAASTQFRSMMLVNLDGSQTPAWMSRHEIWLDFEKYGFEQAVGAIKLRAQEVGAVLRVESAVERVIRTSREQREAEERDQRAQNAEGSRAVGGRSSSCVSPLRSW